MDCAPGFTKYVEDGGNDPRVIAAMVRVMKSAQEKSERSQREAETAKSDYNSRMRDLGPNVRVLVQKIEEVRGDVTPLKNIPSREETVGIVREATHTMSNNIDSRADRTVADIKSILDTQANRFQTTVTKQDLDKGIVDLRTGLRRAADQDLIKAKQEMLDLRSGLTRDFGHELFKTKEEILARHEAGEFATRSLASGRVAQTSLNKIETAVDEQALFTSEVHSHVKAMAANIESLEGSADKNKTESDGTWNRLFDVLDEAFSKLATAKDVQEIESMIAARVESLPKVDNVQMGRIETTATTKLDQLMEELQEKPTRREYGDVLKEVTDLSRDSIVHELQSVIAVDHEKAMEEAEGTLDTLRCELQEGLEALGATAKTAARALFERTELIRKDSEQALASLRSEYEAKLKGKDAEIELLKESVADLRKVCADNKATIEKLETVNSTNAKELQNAAASREKLESNFREQVQEDRDYCTRLNNELEKRAVIINANNNLLVQSKRETNEEVMKNTELVTQAELSKKQCEGLQADVNRLTQAQSQLLGRIDILRRYHTSPDGSEANDISGLFYELGAQLRDLKMDDIACVEGEEFLVLLASKLIRVGSVQRLRHFVSRIQDDKPRCFSQVCRYGNAESLEGRQCEQHGSQCIKMCVRIESSGNRRLIHFRP